jgi:hypothetical protein
MLNLMVHKVIVGFKRLVFRLKQMEQQIITAHTQDFEKEAWFLQTLKMTIHMVTFKKRNKCYLF